MKDQNKILIFSFILILGFSLNAQYTHLKFENLSTSEGLSSSTCMEIFQDSEGYIWLGTIDGLNRYDGYEFTIYRPIINDPYSISNNRINAIAEDHQGYLWVGTSSGLNLFDKNSEKFYRIAIQWSDKSTASTKTTINDIFYDKKTKYLWIATKEGLGKISLNNVHLPLQEPVIFEHFTQSPGNLESLSSNEVVSIFSDNSQEIWVATDDKYLNHYLPETNHFEQIFPSTHQDQSLDHIPNSYLVDSQGNFLIGNNLAGMTYWNRLTNSLKQIHITEKNIPIFNIYQDTQKMIWISTDGYGIYLLDENLELVKHIIHQPSDPFSLPNDQPSFVLQDREGIFWIASYNKGISKLNFSKSLFGHFFYQSDKKDGLSDPIAQAVLQDRKGRIWIGTDGGGLHLFHEKSNSFEHINTSSGKAALSSDKILYLMESTDGTIWISTWDGGVNAYNPEKKQTIQYKHNPKDLLSIGQNTVWCSVQDPKNYIWLGTQNSGLNRYDPYQNRFYQYTTESNHTQGLLSNFVFSLFIDSKNRLLVGTALGLNILDLNKQPYAEKGLLKFDRLKETSLQGYRVNYIIEDYQGTIWMGTDLGLHHLASDLSLLKTYTTSQGLPNNLVVGIAQDSEGLLWITTKSGLSRFNPKTESFYNFNVHDGLQGMEFQSKSIEKLQDGRLLVGGINGFNLFDPHKIDTHLNEVTPVLTGFKLFNNRVLPGDSVHTRILFQKPLTHLKELTLRYHEDQISFDFVALNYENPERVQYAYQMEGLDPQYIYNGTSRSANYSSIAPGTYTFRVKAKIDGTWKEAHSTALLITILPPPWKTWWAYLLYVVIISGMVILGFRYYTRKLKEEREHEMDQMKLRFFMNVSHEFRTPLTLILNPIDKILSTYNDPQAVRYSALTVQRSARRLLSLVNQILDIRKMDMGQTSLQLERTDIKSFVNELIILFQDVAKTKDIQLTFESNLSEGYCFIDTDKFEKILTNLLSNALKFTDREGKISVSLADTTIDQPRTLLKFIKLNSEVKGIQIKVTDTGIGLKEEQLKDIFTRFFHVDNTKTGTGIGLNYTKSLVELHQGHISVQSTYLQGTEFTIVLPVTPLSDESLISHALIDPFNSYASNSVKATEYEIAINDNHQEAIIANPTTSDATELPEQEKTLVLIVEDNRELRMHLRNELKPHFKVKEAINGEEGLEKARKFYPDMIISDVMMPKMDGFEMCRQLKNNLETCHLPIILLTARSLEEDRIEGYNTGADEYLPKPFNINVLKARIRNLLDSRKKLRDKFTASSGVTVSAEITTNTLDEAFLDKATSEVLKKIDNPNFNLEDLITEMGMSRSHFFRKIQSITGQNPSTFIRTIRLKKATELLVTNSYTIKEIAFMVGFNSAAYFTKTFKELYQMTPNEYLMQHTSKDHVKK